MNYNADTVKPLTGLTKNRLGVHLWVYLKHIQYHIYIYIIYIDKVHMDK